MGRPSRSAPGRGLQAPQRTSVDGLFLAGDWTDTGWPATMEGAVRSGYLAAQGVLEDLDQPTRLIRPGLKSGILATWLLGSDSSRRRAGIQFVPVLREGRPTSPDPTPPEPIKLG